jgi:hypothetical protein
LNASDRDVFVFLVDEARPIELDSQAYYRGFYIWNSEVGKAAFGLASFLYSYVYANRIVWGARDVKRSYACATRLWHLTASSSRPSPPWWL